MNRQIDRPTDRKHALTDRPDTIPHQTTYTHMRAPSITNTYTHLLTDKHTPTHIQSLRHQKATETETEMNRNWTLAQHWSNIQKAERFN